VFQVLLDLGVCAFIAGLHNTVTRPTQGHRSSGRAWGEVKALKAMETQIK